MIAKPSGRVFSECSGFVDFSREKEKQWTRRAFGETRGGRDNVVELRKVFPARGQSDKH